MSVFTPEVRTLPSVTDGISEEKYRGIVVLSPTDRPVTRRVLYVNCYGGASVWDRVKRGEIPPHHLWGCLELVRKGYQVALAEPVGDFYFRKKPLPHDLLCVRLIKDWLGKEGIVYSGHNTLYWIPFLKALRLLNCRVVSLLYAREPLNFAKTHTGIIALNPAAADQAKKLAPHAKVVHLGWGADLGFFPRLAYQPESFLSCGITHRDHRTLSRAAELAKVPIRVICPEAPANVEWPENVQLVCAGAGINTENKTVTYQELLCDHYARSTASLIILRKDTREFTAVGFTNLIEAMAMARPVILTKTGAVPSGIDVEAEGCGLFVPPEDPERLAEAMRYLADNPEKSRAMGEAGRRLCESHYNIERYARELDAFFATI